MPCWQTNTLQYDSITIKPELMAGFLANVKRELTAKGIWFMDNADVLIADTFSLGKQTGTIAYTNEEHKNIVKRAYSLEVVKSVANRSAVFRQVKSQVKDSRHITLSKR